MIIEKVTGQRYQQEITDRIVLPLRPPDTTAPQTDTHTAM
jgi:CubicO group peptidase (beta-lactamase class C family)